MLLTSLHILSPGLKTWNFSSFFPFLRLLTLLGDDDGPLVLGLTAVHDVLEPSPNLEGVLAALAGGAHGGVEVLSTVVDDGDGADEVLGREAIVSILFT